MYGGTAYLFDTGPTGGYQRLFGPSAQDVGLEPEELKILAGQWFVCSESGICLKAERERLLRIEAEEIQKGSLEEPAVKNALERRWLVFYTVGELLRAKHDDEVDLASIFKRLADPEWTDGKTKQREAISQYVEYACEILIDIYRNERRDKDFTHRNWHRDQSTLAKIQGKIRMSRFSMDRLPSFS